MSLPLNSSDQKQLQAIDSALADYIQQAENGDLNQQKLTQLEQQLSQLAKNPKIPDNVRQSLQGVLNELKQVKTSQGGGEGDVVGSLYNLKFQIDNLIPPKQDSSGGEGGDTGANLG